jgi:hypothetical protein
MTINKKLYFFLAFLLCATSSSAQQQQGIYVDPTGVIRWETDHKEAAFFGVNYTVPFAYGYRAVKRMGVSPEEAIKADVYHFSRLGLDAFRVHVWDTEISDSLGNLIKNEHLRLFDFLIAELKKRNIKTLVTPIAFWGNGYPEKDQNTGSFSSKYGKQKALVNEEAFKAQENYLKQFFMHKNQYTGLTYQNDPDVLATEINNEPQHSGPAARTTEYIDRMTRAIKSTGWTKPIFYNISESPSYAAAIVKADVKGHSFQWYPTGLVAGHTLKGNYLPNVASYQIPFDTIPEFKKRAKVVYEFDAGDVMAPIMYPAMARSFRAAGFQWATQFAYDPMATAYANTEYQTHYLNLAYTPAKAMSLLIASKVFHENNRLVPVTKATDFGSVQLNYQKQLSEMNTANSFYYSNTTTSVPKNTTTLTHIAGVGNSLIASYEGKGAYFIDRLEAGVWRLEVMPDAIAFKDPFERASPSKTVTAINWATWPMAISLADLGTDFEIKGLNEGNVRTMTAQNGAFAISPGSYLLIKKGTSTKLNAKSAVGNLVLGEYVAPKATVNGVQLMHQPLLTVAEHTALSLSAEIVGISPAATVTLQLHNAANQWENLSFKRMTGYTYSVMIPAALLTPGVLSYNIAVHNADGSEMVFPANQMASDLGWDRLETPAYQTRVAAKGALLEIFNANSDATNVNVYNPDWQNKAITYVSDLDPSQLGLKLTVGKSKTPLMGFQSFFGDKLIGRNAALKDKKSLVLRLRADVDQATVKVGLIDVNGHYYATAITVGKAFQSYDIPLSELKPASQLLLPRPYPGFLPLYYKSSTAHPAFRLADAEKLEITFGYETAPRVQSVTVETVYLK